MTETGHESQPSAPSRFGAHDVDAPELERTRRVLEFITRFQSHVLATGDLAGAFDEVLELAVWITDSEFGFVGEVEEGPGPNGEHRPPVLVSRSITDIAWDDASRAFLAAAGEQGLRFENLESLFGITLTTGETVFANTLDDPRRGGTPHGHPPILHYLGTEFRGVTGSRGMIGLANRPGGYDDHQLELLQPLLSAAAALLDAEQHRRQADDAQRRVEFARDLERIMTTLSLELLDSSTEPSSAAIEAAMGGIGELVGADRVYVFEFHDDGELFSNTFEWCAPGVSPSIDMLQDLPLSVFPWAMERLTEHRLVVTRTDDLPPEADSERETLEVQDIQAVMWIPLQRDGRTVGFVGLDQVRVLAEWTEYDETALRALGGTFSLAVARFRSQVDLRASEERLQRFASNLDAGMFIADHQLVRGEFANPAYADLTGIDESTFRDDPGRLFASAHPDDIDELDLHVRRFLRALADPASPVPTLDRTFRLTVQDATRWVRLRAFALDERDGRPRRIGALLDDVTELRTLQDTLTGALDRVAASNRMKTEFLSRVSHELRSPLQGTLGFLELLRLDPDDPGRLEYIDLAERSARHLVDLIDELLQVGRIEAGRLELTASLVDLATIAHEIVAVQAPVFAERDVHATVEAPTGRAVVVRTDERRLSQIVTNLVSNAAKYNRPDGSVRITIREIDGEGVLEVIDTGPGLTEDELDRIFIPFERLDAERSGIPGTGIGLVVVKQLAGALGARLEVESVVGTGSTFRIALPTADSALAADESSSVLKVLHIEDNPESRMVISAALGRLEHIAFEAAVDLDSGFAAAVLNRPDLILLDRHLPDGDGIESIARLVALGDDHRPVRVAIVSADAEPDSRERALRAGAVEYFVKPVRLADLITYVNDQAQRHRGAV
jgi:signal transduction histidine kinase/ActR/RegA family two-component response regulator